MSKRHTEQFKQVAVGYVLLNKVKPVKANAQSLGVGCSTLDNWVRTASGTVRPELRNDQLRIRQLEREVAHLKELNEVIQKAHLYFVGNPSRCGTCL